MENWQSPTRHDRLDHPDVDGIVQLRRYSKQKRIGVGSFSHVFLHYDEQEGKQRAIKRCHYGRVKGGVPSIALKELQILSTLSFSPHVVTLYDTFIHKGRLHMVLDYAPCTLQEVLDSGKHLTFEFIKIVFRQILYALKDCHENGVLHRDLKPSNVLILNYQEPEWSRSPKIMICDFGMASFSSEWQSAQTTSLPDFPESLQDIFGSAVKAHVQEAPMSPSTYCYGVGIDDDLSQYGNFSNGLSDSDEEQTKEDTLGIRQLYKTNRMFARVTTLCYRSPELLFDAPIHGAGVDMWAAGCLLAELLRHRRETSEKEGLVGPLFFSERESEIEILTQLIDILGSPNMDQNWPEAKYFRGALIADDKQPSTLRQQLPSDTPTGAIDLVQHLLEWNPRKRLTARDCLELPWLNEDPIEPSECRSPQRSVCPKATSVTPFAERLQL